MRYKGDKEKALEWLKRLPMKYDEYVLDNIYKGDYLMWTKDYGLQIIMK
jgi:hypothetical protein